MNARSFSAGAGFEILKMEVTRKTPTSYGGPFAEFSKVLSSTPASLELRSSSL